MPPASSSLPPGRAPASRYPGDATRYPPEATASRFPLGDNLGAPSSGGETPGDEANPLGPLAHRMNHSLSYLVSHLNSLAETVERSRLATEERTRILGMSAEALESAERLADLIRQLKVHAWGSPATRASRMDRSATLPPPTAYDDMPHADDDTWDSETTARILVIDHEAAILQAVQRALQTYAVELAGSADLAKELIKRFDFDLILCDLVMPGMSGMDLYEWMKANRPEHVDRVIFMTGGVFSGQLRTFLSGIRNPVLHKPFDTKTLRWMIAQKLRELDTRTAHR